MFFTKRVLIAGLSTLSFLCNGYFVRAHEKLANINCELVALTQKKRTKGVSIHASHPHIPFGGKQILPGISTNWSGYVSSAIPSQKSVSSVSGSWKIPGIKQDNNKIDSFCAIWVGIDGYSESFVEQIGTMQDFVKGALHQYAWFEMYPAGSYMIKGFPVETGDIITSSVNYSETGVFTLTISNLTKKVTYTVPTSYTKSSNAPRKSAEWIVEAPYELGILPLANFGLVSFVNCTATINGVLGTLNPSQWISTALTMITNTRVIQAVTSSIGNNGSFSVAWKSQ